MKHIFIIGQRVLTQLRHDKRFLAVALVGPLIIIYFLKIFMDAANLGALTSRFIMPIAAFIVHFVSFLLCAIVLVQERTAGTLERMLIAGFRRSEIIGGYIVGYFGLATIQAAVVLADTIWLFELDYDLTTLWQLFLVIWLLAIVSVLLGIFISTFARHEGHVFPFVPLIIMPSVFLSGMIVDNDKLPDWGQWVGKFMPLHYANNAVQEIIGPAPDVEVISRNLLILGFLALVLLLLASQTLPETE